MAMMVIVIAGGHGDGGGGGGGDGDFDRGVCADDGPMVSMLDVTSSCRDSTCPKGFDANCYMIISELLTGCGRVVCICLIVKCYFSLHSKVC